MFWSYFRIRTTNEKVILCLTIAIGCIIVYNYLLKVPSTCIFFHKHNKPLYVVSSILVLNAITSLIINTVGVCFSILSYKQSGSFILEQKDIFMLVAILISIFGFSVPEGLTYASAIRKISKKKAISYTIMINICAIMFGIMLYHKLYANTIFV